MKRKGGRMRTRVHTSLFEKTTLSPFIVLKANIAMAAGVSTDLHHRHRGRA